MTLDKRWINDEVNLKIKNDVATACNQFLRFSSSLNVFLKSDGCDLVIFEWGNLYELYDNALKQL